jgi:hypothetical protein
MPQARDAAIQVGGYLVDEALASDINEGEWMYLSRWVHTYRLIEFT